MGRRREQCEAIGWQKAAIEYIKADRGRGQAFKPKKEEVCNRNEPGKASGADYKSVKNY